MADDRALNFLDRTLDNLQRAWTELAQTTRQYIGGQLRPDLPDEDLARLRRQMESCIGGQANDISARARAAELGRAYMGLNQTGRMRFLVELATGFDIDRDTVDAAIETVAAADDEPARRVAESRLRQSLEPRWRALLRRFTTLPEGVKFLVDLRAGMLPIARDSVAVRALSDDLRVMLAAWFDIGLLDMRRIDWTSPAALLEKLIAYESVHAIKSWDDLKNRLGIDRRCFGFFHLNMPDEPLIFVEVALVNGMAPSVDQLLDEAAPEIDPETADTAIFYSISNAQRGLVGISFGNFLIKRVVEVLGREFPNLKTFATLSPIPGFSRWLDGILTTGDATLLTAADRKQLRLYSEATQNAMILRDLLARADWRQDDAVAQTLREPLTRLAARYLTKGRSGRVLDPVGHFHLSNGARVERLNWMGDRSELGLKRSYGLMINYLYRPGEIEDNSAGYLGACRVPQSAAIRTLARE